LYLSTAHILRPEQASPILCTMQIHKLTFMI
jgi:hypothetical protein